MAEAVLISPRERAPFELVYSERASRGRSLHILLQDHAARAGDERGAFLAAAFRDVVARYQSPLKIESALALLRRTVRVLDELSIQVDTRVDDFRGLGIYLLAQEAGVLYLLCARDAPARVRVKGVFVPLHGAGNESSPAEEISIETARTQHDLFAATLPESMALFRIVRPADFDLELVLGGTPADMAPALDALEARPSGVSSLVSDRIARAVLYVRVEREPHQDETTESPRAKGTVPAWRAVVAAAAIVGTAAGIGWIASRVDLTRAPVERVEHATATQTRPTPVVTREAAPENAAEPAPAVPAAAESPAPDGARFEVAWEQTFAEPVTSSPSIMGEAVVFGGRDGKVYAVERESGDRMWSHAAVGGVGASPLVYDDAVIVADYGGNVYRLARANGKAAWKRALRERIVSTPCAANERVAVGTAKGNVVALSLETGRVLWKFGTRGQVRGGIAHAQGTFFVPSHDGRLYALADDTGRKRWSVALGGPVGSTPYTDGERVVVGTAGGSIVAHAVADGKRLWSFATRAAVNSSILIHEGRVYAGSGDEQVYCLDAKTGDKIWSFATSGAVLSRPFVDQDRLIVTSYDGSIYALDLADGELVDRFGTEQAIYSSPIVDGERVYFGNNGGRFYCLSLRDS